MFRQEHNYKDFFAGAVLGGTLGAVTALMFTEQGKKMQRDLMHKYHEIGSHLNHYQKAASKKLKKPKVKRTIHKIVRAAKNKKRR